MEPTPPEELTTAQPEQPSNEPKILLPQTLQEANTMLESHRTTTEVRRLIDEQRIAYRFWLNALDRKVEQEEMSPEERTETIATFMVAQDLESEDLYKRAKTDKLTLLPNREGFEEMLAEKIRKGGQFGFLMLDADHFKRINDTYGHLTGDLVLKAIANILRENVRQFEIKKPTSVTHPRTENDTLDFVARLGGEEFGLIIDEVTTPEELQVIADRINTTIKQASIEFVDKDGTTNTIQITSSIGGSLYEGGKDIIEEADKNLYRAKDAGRDRAIIQ